VEDDKPQKLSFFERRKFKNKPKFNTYYHFQGILPNFRGIERVKISKLKRKKEKASKPRQVYMLCFLYLSIPEIILHIQLCSLEFFHLVQDTEFLSKLILSHLGQKLYSEY